MRRTQYEIQLARKMLTVDYKQEVIEQWFGRTYRLLKEIAGEE